MNDPTIPEIQTLRTALAPYILQTPIHRWEGRERDARFDGEVVLKLELFQHTGTFKPRGALSNMLALSPEALARGITAVSAGNHAIAAAYAAQRLGVPAKVVMLASANPARVQRAKAYGAEVLMAPDGKSAFELAGRIEREEGRAFIHPFEGHRTALGTATVAAEWHEQAPGLDALVIPVGGGGLIAGIAAATRLLAPGCKVYGVEPDGADTMHRSFAAGEPVARSDVATIADSLAPPYALPYTFGLCRKYVDELVLIDDDQIRDAMGVLFREMKLAVEPSGAAATAALFGPLREKLRGQRVGVIACGANIDIAGFAKHIGAAEAASGLL